MEAQIENHLPLITARLVFAPKVFPSPPTIAPRMEFPSINIEGREDFHVPENGGHQRRAGTPARCATTPKQASTPEASAIGLEPVWRSRTVGPLSARESKIAFDENMERDSLSSLIEDEDMDEETGTSDAEHDVIGGEGVGGGLILKPKSDVSRPGRGGYNLFKVLGWKQKIYASVLVSNAEHILRETRSHQTTRYSSQNLPGKGSIQHEAIGDKASKKCRSLQKRSPNSS
jgi:hypothetical protein